MTTLHDLKHIFSAHGVDAARITQSPNDSAFVITVPCGGYVRLGPVEDGTTRSGWAYTAHDATGEQTERGGSTAPAPEALLPALQSLLGLTEPTYRPTPASARQLKALRELGHPREQRPFTLHLDSPAVRWILALLVAWLDLADSDHAPTTDAPPTDGPGDNAALVTLLAEGLIAIGLGDVSVHELAVRLDRSPAPAGEHPAVGLIETVLDAADTQRTSGTGGSRSLARDIAEALRLDDQLVTHRHRPEHRVGPDNEDRAGWAEAALDAVIARTGDARPCYRDPDSLWEAGGDLVANLMHLADRAGLDPQLLVEAGQRRHRLEHALDHDRRTCSIPGCRDCDPST